MSPLRALFWNACLPIVVKDSGNVREDTGEPLNARASMNVVPSFNFTVVSDLQFWKAELEIVAIPP